jgi:hypothetical protein
MIPVLKIEYLLTSNDPTGEPWPPDGFAVIVRRFNGWTKWRRITLQASPVQSLPSRPRGLLDRR